MKLTDKRIQKHLDKGLKIKRKCWQDDSNQLFTLVCYLFVFFLSTVGTAKLAIMNPRPQSTVHIHASGLRER